ncbi:MAG TPA: hypothetical protein VGQ90_04580 [Stellaceae bacterium]|nr:hypothetical protein [Stellaceae bacterium]
MPYLPNLTIGGAISEPIEPSPGDGGTDSAEPIETAGWPMLAVSAEAIGREIADGLAGWPNLE